jgi:hypothetical protein
MPMIMRSYADEMTHAHRHSRCCVLVSRRVRLIHEQRGPGMSSNYRVLFWFVVALSTLFKAVAIVSIVSETFSVGLTSVVGEAVRTYKAMFHPLLDWLPVWQRPPLTETEKDIISLFLLITTSVGAVRLQHMLRAFHMEDTNPVGIPPSGSLALLGLLPIVLILLGFTTFLDKTAAAQVQIFVPITAWVLANFGVAIPSINSSILLGFLMILTSIVMFTFARATRRMGPPYTVFFQQHDPLGLYLLAAVAGAAGFFAIEAFTPG